MIKVSVEKTANKALRPAFRGSVLALGHAGANAHLLKGLPGCDGKRQGDPSWLTHHPFLEPAIQAGSPAPSGSQSEIAETKVPPIPEGGFFKNAERQTHEKVMGTAKPRPQAGDGITLERRGQLSTAYGSAPVALWVRPLCASVLPSRLNQ